jgi:hypothetical protein
MGEFYYSKVKIKPTLINLEKNIIRINNKLFADKYRVERIIGIPISRADDRKAMWAFWLKDWLIDAAFTIVLLRNGQLEFKVPRSQWDEYWRDQQKIRKKLVRLYNSKK